MANIDTSFLTKTAKTLITFGVAHTFIAHIREYPAPQGKRSTTRSRPATTELTCQEESTARELFSRQLKNDIIHQLYVVHVGTY